MPIDYAHYPPNWLTEIRPRILVRAGERRDADGEIIREAHCEKCASPNHGVVYRWAGNYMLFASEDLLQALNWSTVISVMAPRPVQPFS